MSRSRQPPQQQLMLAEDQYEPPSKCAKFLLYTWKFCTGVFSHLMLLSMVVSYCILGAVTFEHLEKDNEIKVKSSISHIRNNYTEEIWRLTKQSWVLEKENWTVSVIGKLGDFEKAILSAMKDQGWDGDENPKVYQWTFAGALFFSIIVITTIGYGHIAPKTHMGKVVTIFYAILGIPLMLLCLSNIGDVMATSFRFLYWRVCCYVCTRKPKKRRHRSKGSTRQPSVRYNRSRSASCKKPVRISQRSGDSGFPAVESLPSYSYSDTECRYNDDHPKFTRNRHLRSSQISRYSDSNAVMASGSRGEPIPGSSGRGTAPRGAMRQSVPPPRTQRSYSQAPNKFAGNASPRAASLDRRQKRSASEARATTDLDERLAARTPMYFNKYAEEATPYKGPKGRNGRNIYDPDDMDSGDELPPIRSKSLPRNRRADFYIEDDIRPSPSEIKRERSPRFDRYPVEKGSRDDLELTAKRRDDLDIPSRRRDDFDRDDYMRNTGESKSSRDLRTKDPKYRHSLEIEDARNRYRNCILQQLSPDDDHHDRRGRKDIARRSRSRFERDSDDEYDASPYYDDDDDQDNYVSESELAAQRVARQKKREKAHAPSARIMSPMGIAVHRQAKYKEDFDNEYDDGYYQQSKNQIKPVPIWLCVFLVISYIIAGAFLFSKWEKWSFLDSVYFCFITLTTIGFGDFVPAQGVKDNSEVSIALCSLYLLFGISLLAMSFNLVQEEVIANVKSVAKRLGIIKPDLGDESEDD